LNLGFDMSKTPNVEDLGLKPDFVISQKSRAKYKVFEPRLTFVSEFKCGGCTV